MSKAYTVSCTRDHHTEEHSRRSYTPMSAEWSLRNENVVIYDCGNDREHFNSFFRPAIEEYNAKQKRKDRKKDLDYLSALENGTEGYGKGDKKEKPFYHCVIQIGNSKTNGVTDNSFDKHHWRQLKAEEKFKEAAAYVKEHLNKNPETEDFKEILKEVAEEILENRDGKYDGVLIHGLTLHCDEPAGTIHLDLRATFYCDGEKTGVSKRVSQNKALKKLGFVTTPEKTNLTKFEEAIKDRVAEKMKEQGYEREILDEHRPHEKNEVYQMRMDAEEAEKKKRAAEAETERRLKAVAAKEEEIQFNKNIVENEKYILEEDKKKFKKDKSFWEQDFEKHIKEVDDAVDKIEGKLKAQKKQQEKEQQKLDQEQEKFWEQIDEWREWYFELLQSINPDQNPADADMELDELQEKLREEFQGWEDRLESQRRSQEKKEKVIEAIQEIASPNTNYYKRVMIPVVLKNGRVKNISLHDLNTDADKKREKEFADMKQHLYGKFSDTDYENDQEDREFQ